MTYLRNSWRYFPKSQGLVNGIILGGAGISSSLLTPLADFLIINPEQVAADKETGLYLNEEVANRVPKYLVILCIRFLILGIVSLLITFPYQKEEDEEKGKEEQSSNAKEKEDNIASQTPLTTLFFSTKNLKLFSFCFCGFCK